MIRQHTYSLGLLILLACPVFGQNLSFSGGGGGGSNGAFHGNATFQLPIVTPRVITGAPYSGEDSNESVQTLSNGTHITHNNMGPSQKTWRDSQGRVRSERSMMGGANVDLAGIPTVAQITDPVAGYAYILDNVNKIAHRSKFSGGPPSRPAAMTGGAAMPPSGGAVGGGVYSIRNGGGGGGAASASMTSGIVRQGDRPQPQMTTESLGTKLIDGVSVDGTRRTTIIPAGMQGNDGPITQTAENWFSKELNLMVLTVNVGADGTTQTHRIANLSRLEPDASLFMVPPDYTIVDETGSSFTIKWGEQQ